MAAPETVASAAAAGTAQQKAIPGSSLKYLDDFIRLKCAPDLLQMGMFPDAKEISETMSCWGGLRIVARKLRGLDAVASDSVNSSAASQNSSTDSLDDAVVVVGDGATPRTASLCAYLAGTGRSDIGAADGAAVHGGGRIVGKTVMPSPAPGRSWRFISIDPILHYDTAAGRGWLDKRNFTLTPAQVQSWSARVRGLTMVRAKIQEITIKARRAIIVLMHAHVTISDVCAALDLSEGLVGAVIAPCCQWEPHLRHLYGRVADEEWHDPCMLSDKNMMRVWYQRPGSHAALHPLEDNPTAPLLDESLTFAAGLAQLQRAATMAGSRQDNKDTDGQGEEQSADGTSALASAESIAAFRVPTKAEIAALPKPKDRRLAYKAARKLAFAQAQVGMTALAADGLIEPSALMVDGHLQLGLGPENAGVTKAADDGHGNVDPSAAGPSTSALAAAALTSPSSHFVKPKYFAGGPLADETTAIRTRKGMGMVAVQRLRELLATALQGGWTGHYFPTAGTDVKATTGAPGTLFFALPAWHAGVLLRSLQASVGRAATTAVVTVLSARGASNDAGASASAEVVNNASVASADASVAAGESGDGSIARINVVATAALGAVTLPEPTAAPAAAGSDEAQTQAADGTKGTSKAKGKGKGSKQPDVPAQGQVDPDEPPAGPRVESVELTPAVRIMTIGVVTAVRVLSAVVFYDLQDVRTAQLPEPTASPQDSAAATTPVTPVTSSTSLGLHHIVQAYAHSVGQGVDAASATQLAASVAGQAEDTVWRHVRSHAIEDSVSGRERHYTASTVIMDMGSGSPAVVENPGLTPAEHDKVGAAGKGKNGQPHHCRRVHPTYPQNPTTRLQVCVARPEKWSHAAVSGVDGEDGPPTSATAQSPGLTKDGSAKAKAGESPSVALPPLPNPSSAGWLTSLRPGDLVLLTGSVGRGFARHGNFLLFATDGLLLYDSVSKVAACDLAVGSEAAAASAAEPASTAAGSASPSAPASTGQAGTVTVRGEAAQASRNSAGQYVRRRVV